MINYFGKGLSLSADSKSPVLSRFPAFGAVNQLNFRKPTTSERPQCGADTQSFLSAVYNKGTQAQKGQVDVLQSGRSMIEMLGVLAIIGVLSVGGIAGYSKAMTKFKINKTIEQISHIVANTRTLYASQQNYGGLQCYSHGGSHNAICKKAHLIPDDMWDGSSGNFYNAFGGTVWIDYSGKRDSSDQKAFWLYFSGLSEEACIELATQDWGSATGSGLIAVAIGEGTPVQFELYGCSGNSSKGIACANGSAVSVPMPISVAAENCTCSGDDCAISIKYY